MRATIELTAKEQSFINAYIEAIYFTDTGDIHQPRPDAELDEDFERESIIDCLHMYSRISCFLSGDNIEQAGHDYWLTRNGCGTGYWDRPEVYGEFCAKLFTDRAHATGEVTSCFDEIGE